MIITRTPYRVSFLGGGTDYPAWYRKHGGAVLSTTIDKYCYVSAKWLSPFYGIKHRVVWSYVETVNTIGEILHPCVREALPFLGFDDSKGLEIHHQGDLPARAGMGSSSSFAVGLINALYALKGWKATKLFLAEKAIELEQNVLQEYVGSQDQVAAAFGGFNHIQFHEDDTFTVTPVVASKDTLRMLNERLMLFYTGSTRVASTVAKSITTDMEAKANTLHAMREMVDLGGRGLELSNLDWFGELLNDSWWLKCQQSPLVSNERIDGIYSRAMQAGALGGKLLGAGKAGFMIFYVPEDYQARVKEALHPLLHVPFKFEIEGSKVVYST